MPTLALHPVDSSRNTSAPKQRVLERFFSELSFGQRASWNWKTLGGVAAPGRMREEVIAQIEQKPVCYLVWSNRTYPEHKALRFGVDFDQTLGHYLLSNYH